MKGVANPETLNPSIERTAKQLRRFSAPHVKRQALHMQFHQVVVTLLALASPVAQAITVDAKALARYDISYAKCEVQIPEMKGHRDEAYLSLWKARLDEKSRRELATARKGAVYQTERSSVLRAAAKGVAPPSSSPLNQQCQALWSESQRVVKAKQ